MNYSLSDLERLFQTIELIIKELEEKHFFSKYTKLFLANGENINVSITKGSIPHLLGININYLQSLNLYKETNSYELLKMLCKDCYKIHNLSKRGIIDYKKLFSKNITEKINGFWTNIRFDENGIVNTELVCKYDSSRSYMCETKNERLNYAIIKNLFGKYYMLWVIKSDEYDNDYIPMSSRVFNCYDDMVEQLKIILTNQEITFLSGAQLDNKKAFNIEDDDKIQKINNLKKYKQYFSCSIDLTRECNRLLLSTKHHKGLAMDKYNESCIIIDAISKGKIIQSDLLSDERLLEIANAFNDYLFSSKKDDSDNNAEEKYSSLIKQLMHLKDQVLEYESQIKEKDSIIEELNESNQTLTNRNNVLETAKEKVYEIIQAVKK